MFEYKDNLRQMTEYEEDLIVTAIYNINAKPNSPFTVYCDTLNPHCTSFIATLIKRVKLGCRGINGCIVYKDRIVFGKDDQKNKPKKA